MKEIELTHERLNCCDEIVMTDDAKLEFTWELWFDVDKYFGTCLNYTNEQWEEFLSKELKLSNYESNMLLHDLNNLRGDEWVEVLHSVGMDTEIISQFEWFTKGENSWINFYTYYNYDTDRITAIYIIDGPDDSFIHNWELTSDEERFLREIMKEYCKMPLKEYFEKERGNY